MTDAAGTWTDERVELLKKLWSEGLSASQIAAELGGVTRNAVIGKVHRLGLSGRGQDQRRPARPRPRKPRARRATCRRALGDAARQHGAGAALAPSRPSRAAGRSPNPLDEDVVIPFSERVTIMELRENMCRWPMGDPTTPEFRFCGGGAATGLPYCAHHARIAYQPGDRAQAHPRITLP